ncbi:MAG: hypothetical protein ACREDL_10370 [Bradyrhizobium sp.]
MPQFYMRRFACADDENKVMVLERHSDVVVADRKSIEGIGYEEYLQDYDDNGIPASLEGDLNKVIETPFSQSRTWIKIASGNCANLDETDRLPLYGSDRHLQLCNLETLRIIEMQQARYLTEIPTSVARRCHHRCTVAWSQWTGAQPIAERPGASRLPCAPSEPLA